MTELIELAAGNVLSPMVLFFVLGVAAGWLRSDLSIPEAISKGLSLYLMLAIGFKGGAELAVTGLDGAVAAALLALGFLGSVAWSVVDAVGAAEARIDSDLTGREIATAPPASRTVGGRSPAAFFASK